MKLYQCPYCQSVKCNLEYPCKGCETFAEYLINGQKSKLTLYDFITNKNTVYCRLHSTRKNCRDYNINTNRCKTCPHFVVS